MIDLWCIQWSATINKINNFILIRHILLSINMPGIRAHETVAGTKNSSFLRHSNFLQWNNFIPKKWERSIKQSCCRFTIHFIPIKIWLKTILCTVLVWNYFIAKNCYQLDEVVSQSAPKTTGPMPLSSKNWFRLVKFA
jgi:hypothetical protein